MKRLALALASTALLFAWPTLAFAAAPAEPSPSLLRTGLLLTFLAVAPAVFISMTTFIRIAVVLAMVRHAFGMPETPPNAVLVSLALLLTAFVMAPTFARLNTDALQPLMSGAISVETAIKQGAAPLREFMLSQVREDDIANIYAIANAPLPETRDDVDILKLTQPSYSTNCKSRSPSAS